MSEPAEVVAEVSRSGLRGRGGAGFQTGVKWRSIVQAGVDADCPVYLFGEEKAMLEVLEGKLPLPGSCRRS